MSVFFFFLLLIFFFHDLVYLALFLVLCLCVDHPFAGLPLYGCVAELWPGAEQGSEVQR